MDDVTCKVRVKSSGTLLLRDVPPQHVKQPEREYQAEIVGKDRIDTALNGEHVEPVE